MKSFSKQKNSASSKRSSLVLLRSALLFITVTLLTATAAYGGTAFDIEEEAAAEISYDTEVAEFLYYSGEYISANLSAKHALRLKGEHPAKDRAAAIKLLTDLKLMRRNSSVERPLGEASFETFGWILDELLKRGEYKRLASLTAASSDPYAAYYHALTLYAKGLHKEAEDKTASIPSSSLVHPYALTLTAQIKALRGDYASAIQLLKTAERELGNSGSEFLNTIRLLKGYALYEAYEYSDASDAFTSVAPRSPVYKEAVIGAAWALIQSSNCKRALSLIESFRPLNPYSIEGRELLLAEAYCLHVHGNDKEALVLAENTLNTIRALIEAYDNIASTNALPAALQSIDMTYLADTDLTHMNEAPAASDIIIESLRLASAAKDRYEVMRASDYYKAFARLKTAFESKETDIDSAIESITKASNARDEWLKEIKVRAASAKALFIKIKELALTQERQGGAYMFRTHKIPSTSEVKIIERWEKTLNRRLSDKEKDVIRIALLDGEDGLWYLNNTQYAQFLYWMAVDPAKKDNSDNEGVLDRMVSDILTFASTGKIPYEDYMPQLETGIDKKKKADEKLLKNLYELKTMASTGSLKAEMSKDKARDVATGIFIKRAKLLRFEIRVIEEKYIAMIDLIKGTKHGL